MNKGDVFDGCEVFRVLRMPNRNDVVMVDVFAERAVEIKNRNVFRMDRDGKVMWQITRIDYPDINWASKHQHAREKGLPGCIEPFMYFRLHYPDGSNSDVVGQMPSDVMDWMPGCKVELANLGVGSQWFSLDVDTGIAVDITPRGFRPW